MSDIRRRVKKAEKQLRVSEKPHPVVIAGMEMSSGNCWKK
jgi:hypothetical protein